ncbi:hypothetical protein GQ55_4G294500 [Panicum hallii var. hallii]|uniref:Uncharacterized protein n=1 Tax=Panicum hallii var. hallii TaxID=1504633 RepID=A0A2T7E1H0_9POAL|nr:hypothetical protein GQ55_4G294500 [Panicum hallii var. hallii]
MASVITSPLLSAACRHFDRSPKGEAPLRQCLPGSQQCYRNSVSTVQCHRCCESEKISGTRRCCVLPFHATAVSPAARRHFDRPVTSAAHPPGTICRWGGAGRCARAGSRLLSCSATRDADAIMQSCGSIDECRMRPKRSV